MLHAVWRAAGRWARTAKRVIVVGPDVDPYDCKQIERAIMTRVQPKSDTPRVLMYGAQPDATTITRIVVEKYQALGPYTWGHDAAFRYDHAAAIKRISHPTMVLTNSGDDIYEYARRAAAMRPDFVYRELQGGTHDIVDQQPEAWSDAVVEYLRRPDATARA